MLVTSLSIDNNLLIQILNEIDKEDLDIYEKISYFYNSIYDKDINMNKK